MWGEALIYIHTHRGLKSVQLKPRQCLLKQCKVIKSKPVPVTGRGRL
jgi:hypothetical protein